MRNAVGGSLLMALIFVGLYLEGPHAALLVGVLAFTVGYVIERRRLYQTIVRLRKQCSAW